MAERAKVSIEGLDNEVVVRGTGEMDLRIDGEFDRALADAVSRDRSVVVDLTGATFIDSAILHSLGKHGKATVKRGDRMRILVAQGSHPEYVLGVVGFAVIMDIDSVEPGGNGKSNADTG